MTDDVSHLREWIVVALMTAWGASAVMKYGGHGLKADVLLGKGHTRGGRQ